MTKSTTTIALSLTPELSEKLDALARETRRDKAELAAEAIASYVDVNAWQIECIKAALDEARSGAPGVPHQEVVRWGKAWMTGSATSTGKLP